MYEELTTPSIGWHVSIAAIKDTYEKRSQEKCNGIVEFSQMVCGRASLAVTARGLRDTEIPDCLATFMIVSQAVQTISQYNTYAQLY